MCIKNKMTIRPFVLGFVLLISKKIRVEIGPVKIYAQIYLQAPAE